MRSFDLSKTLFIGSLTLAVFAYGAAVGRYQIFPFAAIQFAWGSARQVSAERETILGLRPTLLMEPARRKGEGVTRFEKGQASPGLTLMAGLFDDNVELRLIRLDGSVVNRWPVRFYDIFPDPSHIQPARRIPQTNWNTSIQGSRVFPDGTVVFSFEGMGLAKLDRCGVLQWVLPQMTHHSVEPAEDGGLWIPSLRHVVDGSKFRGLKPPYDEDTILKVSQDGQVLQEISLFALFYENGLERLLFSNSLIFSGDPDLTHLNDIEELTNEMAPRFPQFAAGDLLLSLRNFHMLMVVDPRTHKVKWHQTGPWIKQHDPDFLPNGKISVFNNNDDGTDDGSVLGGDTIVEVDSLSGLTSVRYGGQPTQEMYTRFRGKHQRLDNGHILITESLAGRVFEVDSMGNVVWEFINRYDENAIGIVGGATRYEEDSFQVKDWSCK